LASFAFSADVSRIRIGTAGWSIPRQVAPSFPAVGSALQRYASRFTVAEINSSFHRPHRPSTWERWRDSVPPDFRFSVKLPKQITHKLKLVDCGEELNLFLSQAEVLGDKLAVLLVQLPPKLEFAASVADDFFARLADRSAARIACEPRHPSWFTKGADELLRRHCAARVAADPAIVPAAAIPCGSAELAYWRLHGSPIKYRSSYEDRLASHADHLKRAAAAGAEVWCIFDNTASSAALGDALSLVAGLAE
jgi:uncharacterized protein YecE (DUF72 family)